MNKEELKLLVDKLELPKDEFYILGSGSLLLYGIRDVAHDLDLCVSEELFNILREKYNIDESSKNACGFYSISEKIEVVVNPKYDFERDFIDGYPVEKLEKILKFKEIRNEQKDIKDIAKIKEYISLHSKR